MSVDLRAVTEEDIRRLDVDERQKLILQIAHSIEDEHVPPLTPEQETYLDDLLAEHDVNPEEGRPWREVMDEIRDQCLKR
ncbi:MAG: addiction module protein [Candidatus Hydrogenedentes bacterium]|nr:addiction module protein [Candidatus Hydrogenedentota bacterium]